MSSSKSCSNYHCGSNFRLLFSKIPILNRILNILRQLILLRGRNRPFGHRFPMLKSINWSIPRFWVVIKQLLHWLLYICYSRYLLLETIIFKFIYSTEWPIFPTSYTRWMTSYHHVSWVAVPSCTSGVLCSWVSSNPQVITLTSNSLSCDSHLHFLSHIFLSFFNYIRRETPYLVFWNGCLSAFCFCRMRMDYFFYSCSCCSRCCSCGWLYSLRDLRVLLAFATVEGLAFALLLNGRWSWCLSLNSILRLLISKSKLYLIRLFNWSQQIPPLSLNLFMNNISWEFLWVFSFQWMHVVGRHLIQVKDLTREVRTLIAALFIRGGKLVRRVFSMKVLVIMFKDAFLLLLSVSMPMVDFVRYPIQESLIPIILFALRNNCSEKDCYHVLL